MILIGQIIISIVLIVLIMLQERGGGSSSLFGGGGGAAYQTRRGLEKGVFWATIVATVLFVALALIKLLA